MILLRYYLLPILITTNIILLLIQKKYAFLKNLFVSVVDYYLLTDMVVGL